MNKIYKNKYGSFATEKFTDLYKELTQEEYEIFNKYGSEAFIVENDECIINPNYEQEQAQKERQRLNNLSMTRGDVFEALILAKGLDEETLKTKIEALEIDEITKKLYLNRLKNAQNFFRGYPIFDILAQDKELGITSTMLDEFFETRDYRKLVKVEETLDGEVEEEAGKRKYHFGED